MVEGIFYIWPIHTHFLQVFILLLWPCGRVEKVSSSVPSSKQSLFKIPSFTEDYHFAVDLKELIARYIGHIFYHLYVILLQYQFSFRKCRR